MNPGAVKTPDLLQELATLHVKNLPVAKGLSALRRRLQAPFTEVLPLPVPFRHKLSTSVEL